jgi:uncharacterized protein YbaR (Trm112 family)
MTEQGTGEMQQASGTTPQESQQDEMLRLLVCPADHGKLSLEGQVLVCTTCGRHFPIEDGVPNMLLNDDEHNA